MYREATGKTRKLYFDSDTIARRRSENEAKAEAGGGAKNGTASSSSVQSRERVGKDNLRQAGFEYQVSGNLHVHDTARKEG